MEKETTTTTDWVDEKRWCMEHSTVKTCQYKQNWEGINMKYMCATVCAWIFIFILLLSYPLLPPARHKYIFFFFFKKIKVKDNLKSFVVMPRLSLGEINSAITKREQQPTIHELITKSKKEKQNCPQICDQEKESPIYIDFRPPHPCFPCVFVYISIYFTCWRMILWFRFLILRILQGKYNASTNKLLLEKPK
jgi:hypothetical protein